LQAVLHQEGFLRPVTDVFGKRGRAWLEGLALSPAGRTVVDTWLKMVDYLDERIVEQTRALERMAGEDARARWLQTVPGIGAYSAMVILAEVGDIARFGNKRALASYAGLTPSLRESAGKRKRGGIGHEGSGTLRWIHRRMTGFYDGYIHIGAALGSERFAARRPTHAAIRLRHGWGTRQLALANQEKISGVSGCAPRAAATSSSRGHRRGEAAPFAAARVCP